MRFPQQAKIVTDIPAIPFEPKPVKWLGRPEEALLQVSLRVIECNASSDRQIGEQF